MEIGLKHLLFAFAALWLLHLGYLLNLSFRQKRLNEEVQVLKRTLEQKDS